MATKEHPRNGGRLVAFVSKLNRLTQERRLLWKPEEPPEALTAGSNRVIPAFFGTKYESSRLNSGLSGHLGPSRIVSRRIGIYEERYPEKPDSSGWLTRIVLVLFDDAGDPVWEVDDVVGIDDLMKSLRYQVSDVDKFIDAVLEH